MGAPRAKGRRGLGRKRGEGGVEDRQEERKGLRRERRRRGSERGSGCILAAPLPVSLSELP